jgi:hypothetical protein
MRNFITFIHPQILQDRSNTENEVGGACGMGEERKVYKVLVAKPEG